VSERVWRLVEISHPKFREELLEKARELNYNCLRRLHMPHTNYHGKKIYYELHGEGEPRIILNGIMMSTLSWSIFLPELTKGNQVILLDLFDQGQSDKMAHCYKQDLQVEMVKAVVDELEVDTINLLGIFYGGEIDLQFALKYGHFIHKLLSLIQQHGQIRGFMILVKDNRNEI